MWLNDWQKAIQAPLPSNILELRVELDFLQRELISWNEKQSMPRDFKNIKIKEWSSFDDGIEVLIEARKLLIKFRCQWADHSFKRFNLKNWGIE
jgi:hypothetical protein